MIEVQEGYSPRAYGVAAHTVTRWATKIVLSRPRTTFKEIVLARLNVGFCPPLESPLNVVYFHFSAGSRNVATAKLHIFKISCI